MRYPYAQGANGATGTAAVAEVLSPYTFSNAQKTGLIGTMPSKVGSATILTPGTAAIAVPQGYYGGTAGDGEVEGDANLITGNIKAGISIFGVAGKTSVVDTASATATAAEILSGNSGYVDGALVTGSMPNKVGSDTILTPGTAAIAVPQGYYGGATGDGEVEGDSNLVAANIISGKTIFGVVGSVIPRGFASGSGTTGTASGGGLFSVSGLSFTPTIVVASAVGTNGITYRVTYTNKQTDSLLDGMSYEYTNSTSYLVQIGGLGVSSNSFSGAFGSSSFNYCNGVTFNWIAYE